MKRKLFSGIGLALAITLLASVALPLTKTQAAEVTLEVLNPKAPIEAPQMISLAPRLDTLAGKRIALVGYSKDSSGAISYADSIADLLHERYGRLSAANPTGVEIIVTNRGAWSDVLGEKGVFAYDTYVRGASATTYTPPGVDAIISGLAN